MSRMRLFVDNERRVPNFNNAYQSLADLPDGATQEVIGLNASDGAATVGVLHRPRGGSTVCAFYMHPRTNQTRPYLAPALLESQIAVWGQMSRHVNNDIDMTHEEVLLDLAAGMRFLREQGFRTIIGIGNSGGSSLLAHYQSEASQLPADRQRVSPAGEPTGFENEDMPQFDMYIALALHPGEGQGLLRLLDPAVVDEHDPVATDPAFDMYDVQNGYRELPESSSYDVEWLKRYRAAQIDRCRRLDIIAHAMLADYTEARRHADTTNISTATARRGLFARIMTIHRTWANPADLDPQISPNRRPLGPIGGEHPLAMNYGLQGFARVLTPRAWLSTWSGLSSRAALMKSIPHVHIPSLFVYPDGDLLMYGDDMDAIFAACPATTKEVAVVEWGQHYLIPAPGMPESMEHPKVRAGRMVVGWILRQLGV